MRRVLLRFKWEVLTADPPRRLTRFLFGNTTPKTTTTNDYRQLFAVCNNVSIVQSGDHAMHASVHLLNPRDRLEQAGPSIYDTTIALYSVY